MLNKYYNVDFKSLVIAVNLVASALYANSSFSQTTNTEHHYRLPPRTQNLTPQSLPEIPPDLNKPPKTIHRIGTAISAPRNSISIKSTDAGVIRRQSPASGCINCGTINSINKIGLGSNMNAIAGGVVAGTIAREVIRHAPYSHDTDHSQIIDGRDERNIAYPGNQYQIGITLDDGRQAIIALPEGASFQQGDRVKWVDGTLMLDRP